MSQQTLADYIAQLEDAAKLIGDRNTSIEAALEAYQTGVTAYKNCQAIIDDAEQQIETINAELSDATTGEDDDTQRSD